MDGIPESARRHIEHAVAGIQNHPARVAELELIVAAGSQRLGRRDQEGAIPPENQIGPHGFALQDLRRPEDVAKIRGKRIHEVLPLPATPPTEEPAAEEAALAVQVAEEEPAAVEAAAADEAPAEEPVAEAEPTAEPQAASEAATETPAEPAAESKPKRRTLRKKKDES